MISSPPPCQLGGNRRIVGISDRAKLRHKEGRKSGLFEKRVSSKQRRESIQIDAVSKLLLPLYACMART
jgi:hypothetical protein